jgi:hypothetical protein
VPAIVPVVRVPLAHRLVGAGGMSEDLAVIHADKVKPQRVDWLWPRYIAFRKLTVKDGDPGLGKSVITVDLTARVSTGSPFPDGARPDGAYRVLLLSAEDGVEDTIVPRLVVAGANLANVDILDHVNDGTGPRPVELPGDLPRIRELVKGEGHALVVIDPLMAFLAGEVNAHRDQDVRRALHPLKLMAEATGAAVLVVRHLNKMTGASALYRGGGSIGIVGAARAGLLVAPDPDDETETRRVLAVTKSNLAAKPPSLAYRIVGDDLYDTAKVAWEGASEHTAEGLLGRPVEREAPAQDRAEAWLRDQLGRGEQLADDLKQKAKAQDLAWRTVQRAAEALEVKSEQRPVPGKRGPGPSWWWLPNGRRGMGAATNTTPNGAHSGKGNPQVSEPEPGQNGMRASAPALLDAPVLDAPEFDHDDDRRSTE